MMFELILDLAVVHALRIYQYLHHKHWARAKIDEEKLS